MRKRTAGGATAEENGRRSDCGLRKRTAGGATVGCEPATPARQRECEAASFTGELEKTQKSRRESEKQFLIFTFRVFNCYL